MTATTAMTGPPVRPAATVLLLRDAPVGLQVFLLRRTSQAVFGGGMYVFPGGRVDDRDGQREHDDAFQIAAIRECFEEAGVLLARTRDGMPVDPNHQIFSARESVHRGERGLIDLLAEHHLEPATDQLIWLARWVTPKGELPRRFDTKFFVAAMPFGQRSRHDDSETVASEWSRPADALRRWEDHELAMFPPTVAQLRFLLPHATVAEAVAAARSVGPPPRLEPKLIPGTFDVVLPGEPGYDDLP